MHRYNLIRRKLCNILGDFYYRIDSNSDIPSIICDFYGLFYDSISRISTDNFLVLAGAIHGLVSTLEFKLSDRDQNKILNWFKREIKQIPMDEKMQMWTDQVAESIVNYDNEIDSDLLTLIKETDLMIWRFSFSAKKPTELIRKYVDAIKKLSVYGENQKAISTFIADAALMFCCNEEEEEVEELM